MMGPQPVSPARGAERAAQAAEDAGLAVADLRPESLRTVFYDVGAVVALSARSSGPFPVSPWTPTGTG